ncbi:MAG: ABC transporter substrate-binding protein [Clostridiales bacterium]|nr:ABC transporter substrate-binding protein [Clostridiales bacterium]
MKKLLALLLALVMCLSLAACGSGDTTGDAATEDETATADTTAEDETDDAEEAADTEEVAAAEEETAVETEALTTVTEGVLTMSTNAAFPPYEMTTDDGGFEGIDVEIATAIAEKLGLELQIDDMDFDSALLAVQQGKSDIVMAGVSVTEDRLLVMDFSDSYATGVQVVIVPEGSEVTVDTLGDYVIGTQRATTGNIYCTDDYGEDHVVAYDNGITAVQALMNGQVDCVVIDSAPAQEFVAANAGLTILDTEYVSEEYAIGMAKGNTALVEAVNNALAELTADGTIQAIVDKYIAAE